MAETIDPKLPENYETDSEIRAWRYSKGQGRDMGWGRGGNSGSRIGLSDPAIFDGEKGFYKTWEDNLGDLASTTIRVKNWYRVWEHNDDKWGSGPIQPDFGVDGSARFTRLQTYPGSKVGKIEIYDNSYVMMYGCDVESCVELFESEALNIALGQSFAYTVRGWFLIWPRLVILPEPGSTTALTATHPVTGEVVTQNIPSAWWPVLVGALGGTVDFGYPIYIEYTPRHVSGHPVPEEDRYTVTVKSNIDESRSSQITIGD